MNLLRFIIGCVACCMIVSCSYERHIGKQAQRLLYNAPLLQQAHVGISVYDADAKKYLYNYLGDKYFIPASTTKLFTLYAGLTYLPDSLIAARVAFDNGTLLLQATGDPTFLHPYFKEQPLFDFLKNEDIEEIRINTAFATESFAPGWSWDDYAAPYMPERDPFPMYGNIATIGFEGDSLICNPAPLQPFIVGQPAAGKPWRVTRELAGHIFTIDTLHGDTSHTKRITMAMNKGLFASRYLADTLHKTVITDYSKFHPSVMKPIYSQPKDSLFKVMMHRSDNFFAEQTLLMAANEYLGEMNDERIIDTLLKTALDSLPQRPRWVDGSGLSRYNFFSPQDFVFVLEKSKADFGLPRMENILPTANEGTLKGYYNGYEGRIHAKTGSLSNNVALSGYLLTKHNRHLSFAILINNYKADGVAVRRLMERFVEGLMERE